MNKLNIKALVKASTKKSMNRNLHKAKKAKNDEFYTQYDDIAKELTNYKAHFKDKIVFCNCDDPEESNFFKYFALNFKHLGLKKLITTHFEKDQPSYILIVDKDINNDGKIDLKDGKKIKLKQNGDFRSPECIELLKECDIVVTNPPFSLFREYVAQLMEYKKKFIIIGNVNAVTYKDIFRFIKDDKMWWGISPRSMKFKLSDGSLGMVNAVWYTNLTHKKRNEEFIFRNKYSKKDYSKYDNYNAIEISKVKYIPEEYEGIMGVPVTFLDKYNPKQFEIIGSADDKDFYVPLFGKHVGRIELNGKQPFKRIFIKNKKI